MTNKIIFGNDLIKVLEKEYKLNKLGEVPTKYKNGVTTIDFIYGKEKDIDDLKYNKPYIEFSIDDETDGFISGTMYPNGGVEGIQFDSYDDIKYFMKNVKWTESKKSSRKSLKEGINDELIATSSDGETTLYLSDERQANHGKDPHYEFKLGENGYFTRYVRCDDNRCENVVLDWIKEFDLDISKSEISRIIKLYESKKSVKKSLKESVDGYIATDEDCNMNGKCWVLDGSYNFIMEFLQEWGIAPKDVKVKNGITTLFNADGNPFGYVYQDEEVDIFVADKTTNWTWKNHNPSTKRVKVTALDEIF